jgi:hypothetical protein
MNWQVILAAELTKFAGLRHLEPMVCAAQRDLRAAEVGDSDVVLADAGYWQQRQIQALAGDGIQVLVAPDFSQPPGGWTGGS